MKIMFLLSAVLTMLMGCSNLDSDNNVDTDVKDNIKTQVETRQDLSSIIKELPTDWVKLTDKDGKLVIYNSCDAGNLLMSVTKKGNKFNLLLHGTQEDDEYEIIDSRQSKDTILLETKGWAGNNKQTFKMLWINKQNGTCRWITTYPGDYTSNEIFVSKDKAIKYETIVQPCVECWGDECHEAQ